MRHATVFLTDISDFTAFAGSADPEDLHDFLLRYRELVRARVRQYGGTVTNYIGSRLMAVSDGASRIRMDLQVVRGDAIELRASVDGERREDRELLSEWSRVILEAIGRDLRSESTGGTTALTLEVARAGG